MTAVASTGNRDEPAPDRAASIDRLRASFTAPPGDSAPMMRWWWFGPSVERTELDRELTAMADSGVGGVEVSYVYPLDDAKTPLGSPEFLADLRFAAERARELRLRFALTLGSGWSFGGSHITPDLAARRLHWDRREIQTGALTVPVVRPWPDDELVAAFVGDGSMQEQPDQWRRIPVVDGAFEVPEGVGPRQILIAAARRTGQNVKRAAFGAEGPVLDHYSAAAAEAHVAAFAEPLLEAVDAELVDSVFCDSLEVYESDWTANLPEEFEQRRGYPLLPRLHLLVTPGEADLDFRADYHQTLTELYEENFVAVFQRWAAGHGVPFRIQGYGTPPATVSSYRFADRFEGEGWGWTEITQTRWATSAAHLYGRNVVSSETWTWLHSPSFRATPLDMKGEAHEHLLAGINQFVGHGWPYSPRDAEGLGWFFYASGALDDRNPWWPAMPSLNRYLTRLCWLMRQGDRVADVLVYTPNRDVFATMGQATGGSLDAWRETKRLVGDDVTRVIRQGGWDFDLVDDDAVAAGLADRARLVVVPSATMIPDATRGWLEQLAASGRSVVLVDSTAEVTGAIRGSVDSLAETLASSVAPDVTLDPSRERIGVVHRRLDEVDVYLVVNTGPLTETTRVRPREGRSRWQRWDAETGAVSAYGETRDGIELMLAPYQAAVLVLTDAPAGDPEPAQQGDTAENGRGEAVSEAQCREPRRLPLNGAWTVEFDDGERRRIELPYAWDDESERRAYSGQAVFRIDMELPGGPGGMPVGAGAAVLDFGDVTAIDLGPSAEQDMRGHSYRTTVAAPVREIALVRVNGTDCGVVWAPPYEVEVSHALRPGLNEIEITVCNTASNALAVDDSIRSLAARSEHEFGRRFRMQELDRAMDGVRSGLLAVPALVFG
jgi:hypothetical protein